MKLTHILDNFKNSGKQSYPTELASQGKKPLGKRISLGMCTVFTLRKNI